MEDTNMNLQNVLDAMVSQLASGKKRPHCYHAWVQGEGYVNDGRGTTARWSVEDYRKQLARDVQSEIDSMNFAPSYAEPGYTQPKHAVLFANWNKFPRGFDRVLERMGFMLEWNDEWSTCESCSRAVRTESDGYGWEPSFKWDGDSTILCLECYKEEHSGDEETEE